MNPADFAALVHARRTNMKVDKQRAVPRELVEQLCELAQWAPNHKRTWPWRFALAEGDGRARLGEVIATAMETRGDEPEKVAKARTKYLRTPAVLIVMRAPRLKYRSSGCSAMLDTAQVCKLEDGQHSSGMRWSTT